MITDFKPAAFKVEKVFKGLTAYLIEQGGDYAVLKAETLKHPGTKSRDDGSKRGAWLTTHSGESPQVKKSITIAAEIIAYVTLEQSVAATRPLTSAEVLATTLRLPDATEEDALDFARRCVWYLMPCYKSLMNVDKRPFPSSVLNSLKSQPNAFESLGRVLVCDMFLGNSDRLGKLRREGGGVQTPANAGNIFLTWYPLRFLCIDFLDTQMSEAPYMGTSWQITRSKLDGQMGGEAAIYNFDLLHTGRNKQRDEAAKWALEAVGNAFNPRVTFNSAAGKALRSGMRAGRDRLKAFYDGRIGEDHWPNGLASRFAACGW